MQHVQKMFSIRDSKGEVYHPPMYANTHGEAERNFKMQVNNEKTMMFQFPEDFDLYYVGDYDTKSGKITPKDTPQHLIKAVAVKQKSAEKVQ